MTFYVEEADPKIELDSFSHYIVDVYGNVVAAAYHYNDAATIADALENAPPEE